MDTVFLQAPALPGATEAPALLAEALTTTSAPQQVVVLTLLLGSAIWAARRPGPPAWVALAACAAVWLRANSRFEGAVLITFAPGRGLTVADLLVPALGALLLARVRPGSTGAADPSGPGSAGRSGAVDRPAEMVVHQPAEAG